LSSNFRDSFRASQGWFKVQNSLGGGDGRGARKFAFFAFRAQ